MINKGKIGFFSLLLCLPLLSFAATPVKSIVIFGDSYSDKGNTTHLLKSLRQEESPAFLVAPLKHFVINKMVDFAEEYQVPQMVLDAGIGIVTGFFDKDLGPFLANLVTKVNSVPILPAKPYWNWRFSNGPVWDEYLTPMLLLSTEDADQYTNKAFGGSFTTTYDKQLTVWNLIRHPINTVKSLIVGKLIPPSLGLTLQAYLLENPKVNEESVFFIYTGFSDYANVLQFEDNYNPAVMHRYINNVVSHLGTAVHKLAKAGAKHFVIIGLTQMGNMPKFYGSFDQEVMNAASIKHNNRVQNQLEKWKVAHPDADFLFINPQDYLDKIQANPEQYELTRLNKACLETRFPLVEAIEQSPFDKNFVMLYAQTLNHRDTQMAQGETNYQVCDNPNQYLYWDDIHLSTKAHAGFAFEVCEAMQEHGYEVNCKSPFFK